jgi:hypothetical protein
MLARFHSGCTTRGSTARPVLGLFEGIGVSSIAFWHGYFAWDKRPESRSYRNRFCAAVRDCRSATGSSGLNRASVCAGQAGCLLCPREESRLGSTLMPRVTTLGRYSYV